MHPLRFLSLIPSLVMSHLLSAVDMLCQPWVINTLREIKFMRIVADESHGARVRDDKTREVGIILSLLSSVSHAARGQNFDKAGASICRTRTPRVGRTSCSSTPATSGHCLGLRSTSSLKTSPLRCVSHTNPAGTATTPVSGDACSETDSQPACNSLFLRQAEWIGLSEDDISAILEDDNADVKDTWIKRRTKAEVRRW